MRLPALLYVLAACGAPSALHCPADPAIVVDTSAHRMALCDGGRAVREVSVAIGGGGVDKQREGDRKTPLGSYPLGTPVPSARFHRFVPVGYPTAAQRAAGKTGGDVGIHGPSRKHEWLGRLRNWVDWTDGCIAVASDDLIDEVVAWIRAVHPARVVIE